MNTLTSQLTKICLFASALVLASCSTVKHGYAYDDVTTPGENVGVLIGYYGVPSLLISEVDGRKFKQTFTQPHPVKIYALPGERAVKLTYLGVPSLAGTLIATPTAKGEIRLTVEAGHTYKFFTQSDGGSVGFYVRDLGKVRSE
jgi:hypothetical protein